MIQLMAGSVDHSGQPAGLHSLNRELRTTKTTIDATAAIEALPITWYDSGKLQLARSPFQELANAVTRGTPTLRNLDATNQ